MKTAYPVNLKKQKDGGYLVSFPNVPEALTDGDSRDEALRAAADCLIAALGGYVNDKRDIAKPSKFVKGRPMIHLSALTTAKLALYQTMRESGITRVALGKRLGVSEGAIRRLLDIDHRSHIGQIDAALAVLGKRLVVETQNAA